MKTSQSYIARIEARAFASLRFAPDQRGNVNDAHRNARFVLENLGNGMRIDEVMKQFPVSR
jgi:hypothetical protein